MFEQICNDNIKECFDEIEKFEQQADCIITHGGVGSIIGSIERGKKVIAVPRLKQYGEHVNDHQLDIVESFDKLGYIIGITDVSQLEEALQSVKVFEPKKNIQNVCVTNSGIQTNGAESIIIIILYKGFTKFGLCIL